MPNLLKPFALNLMNIQRLIHWLCFAFATCGALALSVGAIVMSYSIVGRYGVGHSVLGDSELSALLSGAAVAWFMPLCQWQKAHISIELLTQYFSTTRQRHLNTVIAFVLALIWGVLTWRCADAAFVSYEANNHSMLLNLPEWTGYGAIALGCLLSCIVAFTQTLGINNPLYDQ